MEKHAPMERQASMGHHSKSEKEMVRAQALREQALKPWSAQVWDAYMLKS